MIAADYSDKKASYIRTQTNVTAATVHTKVEDVKRLMVRERPGRGRIERERERERDQLE